MLLSLAPAAADDTSPAKTGIAIPSVEELAIPDEANKGLLKKPTDTAREDDTREALCLMIKSAAKANDLPLEFFARVIWQESRFQSNAVGPVTRNGQRAEGIAQFMPGTASERAAARSLRPGAGAAEIRGIFERTAQPVRQSRAGRSRLQCRSATGAGMAGRLRRTMPQETRNYVAAITGTSVDDWAPAGKRRQDARPRLDPSCRGFLALLKRAPNPFVTQLEHHVRRASRKLWGVQFAAGFNRDNALAMYARAMKGLSDVIGKRDANFLVHTQPRHHSFYQVQIGTDTRREADDLCSRMRRAGGACFVLKNMIVRG